MITWFKQLYARFIRWFGDGSLISNPKVGFNGCATVQQAPEKPTLTYGEPTLVSTLYPNAEDITLELSFTNHMYMLTPEALHVSGRFPEGNSTWAIVDEEMNGRIRIRGRVYRQSCCQKRRQLRCCIFNT